MNFRQYQHIERFGKDEVDGIEVGTTYVFPKIDGTNSSVWLNDDGELRAGSHTRELTFDNDNAGFYAAISKDERIIKYLWAHPTHRLFGEWLVPHSLKTYRQDAWRRFYIFDVTIDREDGLEYLPYTTYQPLVEEFGLDYIMPIRILKNGDYDAFVKCLDENVFLIQDGKGVGEGIVIKNYDFYNKYGRQTWAKIVTSEFKEVHYKAMGCPETEIKMVEQEITDQYLTHAFVDKEYEKINNKYGGFTSKNIPELLNTVYHELVCEEMWNIIKDKKNPKVDFKILQRMIIAKVKQIKPDIFG